MKRWLYRDTIGLVGSLALLPLRIVMGLAFILHGWGKVRAPFSWMGEGATVPGILQAMAAFSEFAGGMALVLGLLTPLASALLAVTMAEAVRFHLSSGDPFVGAGGPSYELAAVYFSAALLFLIIGPGRYSLDAVAFGLARPVKPATG